MRKSDKASLKEFEKRAKKSGKDKTPPKKTSKEIDPSFTKGQIQDQIRTFADSVWRSMYEALGSMPASYVEISIDTETSLSGISRSACAFAPTKKMDDEQKKKLDQLARQVSWPNPEDLKKEMERMRKYSSVSMGYFYAEPPPTLSKEQVEIEKLTCERDQIKRAFDQQTKQLAELADAAHTIATVVDIRGERMTVVNGGQQVDVRRLDGVTVGSVVLLVSETMQPLSIMTGADPAGQTATVKCILNGTQIEIESNGTSEGRVVRCSIDVREGDRVILDQSQSVVLQNLGKPKSVLAWEKPTNTTWDDIGGHEEAKKALQDAIETPVKHPELFAQYGRRPCKGVLLYGPPGTGKTLLAKASATALARVHGKETAVGFIYVKGPELLSKWVGESESGVRALFAAAREHKRVHGYPALVFIDEAEAILGKRGESGRGYMTQTMVPQFLAEMDGLEDSGCMVLLATNRASDLDPAVTREGRIDRKVKIGRPNQTDTGRIASIHLRNRPLAEGESIETLSTLVSNVMHSEPIGALINPTSPKTFAITLSAFSSGAMIAGIVEEAATSALTRDIENGTGVSGIRPEDIQTGISRALAGLQGLDHTDVAMELIASHSHLEELSGSSEPLKVSLSKPGSEAEKLSN